MAWLAQATALTARKTVVTLHMLRPQQSLLGSVRVPVRQVIANDSPQEPKSKLTVRTGKNREKQ